MTLPDSEAKKNLVFAAHQALIHYGTQRRPAHSPKPARVLNFDDLELTLMGWLTIQLKIKGEFVCIYAHDGQTESITYLLEPIELEAAYSEALRLLQTRTVLDDLSKIK